MIISVGGKVLPLFYAHSCCIIQMYIAYFEVCTWVRYVKDIGGKWDPLEPGEGQTHTHARTHTHTHTFREEGTEVATSYFEAMRN